MSGPELELLSGGQKRLLYGLLGLGALALGVGLATHSGGVYSGILLGFLFMLELGLGGALFLCINATANARWHTVFRRVPEGVAATLPWAALLVLLFVWAVPHIYPWAAPGFYTDPSRLVGGVLIPELKAKEGWLQPGWFSLRAVLFVAWWAGLMSLILRLQRGQGLGGANHAGAIRKLSILFCVTFAYTFSVASFDWLMSLEPRFYSTIFGVYCFAGVMQLGFAVVLLLTLFLDAKGAFKDQIREQHRHDLGKWLFAFSCFWAYIWFFQFMLIWYADLPDESRYYVRRGGLRADVMALVVLLRFCVPFFGLASQKVKKNPRILAAVALIVVAGHWLDLALMALPSQAGGMRNLYALLIPVGTGAAFVLLFFRAFAKKPALPEPDAAYAYSRRYLT